MTNPKLPLGEYVRRAVRDFFDRKTWVGSPLRFVPVRYQEQIAAAITSAVEEHVYEEMENEREEWAETHADFERMELWLKGIVSNLEGRVVLEPQDLYNLDEFYLAAEEGGDEGSVKLTTVIIDQRGDNG